MQIEGIDLEKLKDNFQKRRVEVVFFNTFNKAKDYLIDEIPVEATVGIGNSRTLKNMKITQSLVDRGNIVFDKTFGKDKDEIVAIKKKALLTDFYISSSNAVSEDGRIVNIDHSGNRVAALIYGPDRVLIIVGRNKITKTHQEALYRARNEASPKNAIRAGYNPTCVGTSICVDCLSDERVCYAVSIIEGQHEKNRMTLVIVDEAAGF